MGIHHSEVDPGAEIRVVERKDTREVHVTPLSEVDGMDLLVVHLQGHPEATWLKLSEKQTRDLNERLTEIVEAWEFTDDDFGK